MPLKPGARIQSLKFIDSEARNGASRVRRTIHALIVNNNRNALGRQVNIQLNSIGAKPGRKPKCSERVFRREPRSAAMRNHERPLHSNSGRCLVEQPRELIHDKLMIEVVGTRSNLTGCRYALLR